MNGVAVELYQDDDMNRDNNMPDNAPRNRVVLPVSLSEAQFEAVDKAAKQSEHKNRSDFVRWVLSQAIEDFPDDLTPRGKHKRTSKD